MKIVIAGDLVPTKSNEKLFGDGNIKELLGDSLYQIWSESDIRIFNLEAPITDTGNPIKKSGPNLKIASNCINGIIALHPSFVVTANNHIMDYGENGWENTKKLLNKAGIGSVGAGDKKEASSTRIIECNGKKIGFYAVAEHEFSICTEERPGANGYCSFETSKKIHELKKAADYVIVFYHGGREHYPYPTPYQQKTCRNIAEMGANLILCQHSHCVGCEEIYNGCKIIYGQGNFIFDYSKEECWKTSILIMVEINDSVNVCYYPVRKSENVVRLAEGQSGEQILNAYWKRTKEIQCPELCEEKYNALCKELAVDYLYYYSGWNKIFRALDKMVFKKKLIKYYYNKRKKVMLLGLLQCETHREIMETYLKECIHENKA